MKFRNRHLIAGFMVDFYAPSVRLAIEVDGAVHDGLAERDAERTKALEAHGVRVLRVRNEDVLGSMEAVIARIEREIAVDATPTPLALPATRVGVVGRR